MKHFLPVLPILLGFILDSIVGDPRNFPHPIRAVGNTVSMLEKAIRSHFQNRRLGGTILALTVILIWTLQLPLNRFFAAICSPPVTFVMRVWRSVNWLKIAILRGREKLFQ